MTQIFHPLLALIASAADNQLGKYVEYLKEENRILRTRIPGQIHTKPAERERLLKYGKVIGRAIEELITIVSPATFYRWVRDAKKGKPKTLNPKGKSQFERHFLASLDKDLQAIVKMWGLLAPPTRQAIVSLSADLTT